MNSNVQTFAFTTKSRGGILRALTNEVTVAYDGRTMTAIALWDTGATNTCISYDIASQLSLVSTGKKNIQTPAGSRQVNTYLIDIILPNNVNISEIEVCDSEIGTQGIGVLIGMDIITSGDFSVSNYNNNTVFTFRIPSNKVTDYVTEINVKNLTGQHGKGKKKKKK